jgi:hypothetical protein
VGERSVLRFDGSAWRQVRHLPTVALARDVWGSSPTNVFVVGENGAILHRCGAAR